MHKLVILIETHANEHNLEEQWPQFLNLAEKMPGLRREVTSRVAHILYGSYPCHLIHEIHFDSPEAAHHALASLVGTQAGQILQTITGGRITLLLADHLEDSLDNIRKSETSQE